MSDLFGRVWKVTVAGLVVTESRVQFHIEKSTGKDPNKCELIITNLSQDSRSKMTAKGMAVTVEAGYKGGTQILFSGQSRLCDHKDDGANMLTKINCGDGEQLYQFQRMSQSFAAGVSTHDVIRKTAKAMSVNLGNLNAALGSLTENLKLDHGFACHGNAFSIFDRLVRSLGFTWSVQQGALLLAKRNEAPIQEVVVLSAATGLLGSPEHSPPTKEKKHSSLVAKSLLNGRIRPGVTVRMDSKNVKGDFIPQKVEHTGDSHGSGWLTHLEAVASTVKTVTL